MFQGEQEKGEYSAASAVLYMGQHFFPDLQGGSILNKILLSICAFGVKCWKVAVILHWTYFADYLSLVQNDIPGLLLLICHSVSSLILHELTNHSEKLS